MKKGYCYLCNECCTRTCPTCYCSDAPTKRYRQGFIKFKGNNLLEIVLCGYCENKFLLEKYGIEELEKIMLKLQEDGECLKLLETLKKDVVSYVSMEEHDITSGRESNSYIWEKTNLE